MISTNRFGNKAWPYQIYCSIIMTANKVLQGKKRDKLLAVLVGFKHAR